MNRVGAFRCVFSDCLALVGVVVVGVFVYRSTAVLFSIIYERGLQPWAYTHLLVCDHFTPWTVPSVR